MKEYPPSRDLGPGGYKSPPISKLKQLYSGYGGGREMPLGGYAILFGVFQLGLTGYLLTARRRARMGWSDYLLFGITTYKLSHILSQDRVTSFLRAPFTSYQGSGQGSSIHEQARGSGLQRAIGDLVTCPYCLSPWVSCALAWAFSSQPEASRSLAAMLAVSAVSDAITGYSSRPT